MIKVYTDGGSRGNPGPAAIGIYIQDQNNGKTYELKEKIGFATNNVAEYKAVIKALSFFAQNKKILEGKDEINFFLDSLLICSQMNGLYKVKDANLRNLLFEVREKEAEIKVKVKYSHIPREQNKKADRLVNMAFDEK
ncbi:MAG: ribonuclease HI family protein [bacterium]|nr:ribonuclease HI family protein [bacterium]